MLTTPSEYRYRAFISYSHRDKAFAAWLHRTLEFYRLPKKLVGRMTRAGPVPARLHPIFRDRDELPASGDLGGELRGALASSQFLLVICSPASAKSHWVHEEILAFKRLHGDDRVLAVIVDGVPYASMSPATADQECFPLSLRMKLGSDGELSNQPAEPIAADIRREADGKQLAKLKLIAGLTGLKLDDIAQREQQRRVRRLAAFATAASIGMIFAIALALYANAARIEANAQRRVAERESATARAASDFLVGTFALSNPATDNPRTVTALTILKRSAERARTELASQPIVQSRLIATLGSAYANLGLFNEAREAIGRSMPAVIAAGAEGADARLMLAYTDFRQGRQSEAMRITQQVQKMTTTASSTHVLTQAKAALLEGQLRSAAADIKGGIAAFDRSIAYYRTAASSEKQLAGVLIERGALLSDAGRFVEAEKSLGEALAINRRVLGETHLATGQSWYAYAQNAFLAGDLPVAEARIGKALAIERRMLDDDNPVIADALSMQGQILQGQRRFNDARHSLEAAVVIYKRAFGKPHYLIGIAQVYLALVESNLDHPDKALRFIDEARRNYDASYGKQHANHGDLLVNRATILAHVGRMVEARADCARGIGILKATLGADAAFTIASAKTCTDLRATNL